MDNNDAIQLTTKRDRVSDFARPNVFLCAGNPVKQPAHNSCVYLVWDLLRETTLHCIYINSYTSIPRPNFKTQLPYVREKQTTCAYYNTYIVCVAVVPRPYKMVMRISSVKTKNVKNNMTFARFGFTLEFFCKKPKDPVPVVRND